VLRARGAGVIHLVRESLAECVASMLTAGQRGYHRTTPIGAAEAGLRLGADLAAAERRGCARSWRRAPSCAGPPPA